MMKCKIEKNAYMSFSGSNVLDQIQDNSTPNIDLLVRESIQNSVDAAKEDSEFVRIEFNTGTFSETDFRKIFQGINELDLSRCSQSNEYLTISDTYTTGLLGDHRLDKNQPQNFRNLVYDIMNKNSKNNQSGGSWGIGKSVYYRFGIGFCIFYSRTFENDEYNNKLAIVLIEDENKDNKLIRTENYRGIAYFGEEEIIDGQKESKPIVDTNDIKKILKVFGEEIYSDITTGTKIIIPYLDKKIFKQKRNNEENYWWKDSFTETLNIAVQRWYFPRLNNIKYNGQYLNVGINDEKVELNHFFDALQKLYNEEDPKIISKIISSKKPKLDYGKIILRKFNKEELFMGIHQYPSPFTMLDLIDERDQSIPIISYVRAPGMIITYDHIWTKATLEEDEYLIGIFKLHSQSNYEKESIEEYVRGTEKANHKQWEDSYLNKFPNLTNLKPVRKIFNLINDAITKEFKKDEKEIIVSSDSRLKKALGKLLLPPSGFGNGASIGRKRKKTSKSIRVSKRKKVNSNFIGFEEQKLVFETCLLLEPQDTLVFDFDIKSGSKTISVSQWFDLDFKVPFSLSEIEFNNLILGKKKIEGSGRFPLETINKAKTLNKALSIESRRTSNGTSYGIKLKNIHLENIQITFKIYVEPLDDTYSVSINSQLMQEKEGDGANE